MDLQENELNECGNLLRERALNDGSRTPRLSCGSMETEPVVSS